MVVFGLGTPAALACGLGGAVLVDPVMTSLGCSA